MGLVLHRAEFSHTLALQPTGLPPLRSGKPAAELGRWAETLLSPRAGARSFARSQRMGGGWPAPNAADLEQERGLSVEQARWLAERFVGHPGRTVYEPAILKRPLGLGGRCRDAREPISTFRELVAVHWPIVSALCARRAVR
jgi:hypothetical protein